MKAYIEFIKHEIRMSRRHPVALIVTLLFPVAYFIVFAEVFHLRKTPVSAGSFMCMSLVVGILGNGLWAAGMRAVSERENNILRRFRVLPISPMPILCASIIGGWLVFFVLVPILCIVAWGVYRVTIPAHFMSFLVFVSLAMMAFRAMGLIVASGSNSAQEATVLMQFLYIPMLFLSGATMPLAMLPGWLQTLSRFTPGYELLSGTQSIFVGGQSIWANGEAVAAMIVTLLVSLFVAVELFRWQKTDKVPFSSKAWILAILAPFVLLGAWKISRGIDPSSVPTPKSPAITKPNHTQ